MGLGLVALIFRGSKTLIMITRDCVLELVVARHPLFLNVTGHQVKPLINMG